MEAFSKIEWNDPNSDQAKDFRRRYAKLQPGRFLPLGSMADYSKMTDMRQFYGLTPNMTALNKTEVTVKRNSRTDYMRSLEKGGLAGGESLSAQWSVVQGILEQDPTILNAKDKGYKAKTGIRTSATDWALLYALNKAFAPTSAVLEGELQSLPGAQSILMKVGLRAEGEANEGRILNDKMYPEIIRLIAGKYQDRVETYSEKRKTDVELLKDQIPGIDDESINAVLPDGFIKRYEEKFLNSPAAKRVLKGRTKANKIIMRNDKGRVVGTHQHGELVRGTEYKSLANDAWYRVEPGGFRLLSQEEVEKIKNASYQIKGGLNE